jgi:hypothetical protein
MKESEILEGNKLVAEFMGATKGFNSKDGEFYYLPNNVPSYLIKELKYHSSYDWIMPVVQKIINLGWQFQLNSYGISNSAEFIKTGSYIKNTDWSTPLLATYNVVIDFIKWYSNSDKT